MIQIPVKVTTRLEQYEGDLLHSDLRNNSHQLGFWHWRVVARIEQDNPTLHHTKLEDVRDWTEEAKNRSKSIRNNDGNRGNIA